MKTTLDKPVLITLFGYPGSGKSYVARNLSEVLNIAHINADRIRSELFAKPRFSAQENSIITHLMNYIAGEFLNAGVSVIYDADISKAITRRKLRELARKHKADYLLVWIQVDTDTSFARTQHRDRRTADDKSAQPHTKESFNFIVSEMQNPQAEDYMVISGKHAFVTQKNAIISRLYKSGAISSAAVQQTVAKPELVNLIPLPNRLEDDEPIDFSYRNITIR